MTGMKGIKVVMDSDRYVIVTLTDGTQSETIRSDKPLPVGNPLQVHIIRGPNGERTIGLDPPATT